MDEAILIVDDNPMNLSLLEFILSASGYAVSTAVDATSALAAIAQAAPRLILMDLQLPGLDGLALTRQLKADPATRAIIVIAVTAYAMKGDEERARLAGCDGYVTKPIDRARLRETVRRHLDTATAIIGPG